MKRRGKRYGTIGGQVHWRETDGRRKHQTRMAELNSINVQPLCSRANRSGVLGVAKAIRDALDPEKVLMEQPAPVKEYTREEIEELERQLGIRK